ncbi:hypothetical protein DL765_000428 [Monosporascus sp. GIB2]|nr:hypothetical protein DL765_000428 [Monosporascus sp. GIB2]
MMLILVALLVGFLPLTWSRAVAPTLSIDPLAQIDGNVTENLHQLAKRVPYAESITKGRRLDCLMSATIARARQLNGNRQLESQIEEWEILISDAEDDEDEGWRELQLAKGENPKYYSSGMPANLNTLTGANFEKTHYYYHANVRDGRVNGQQVLVSTSETALKHDSVLTIKQLTRAEFANGMNGEGGVIIADKNKSPRAAIGQVPPFPISRIKQWSDAAFGQWELAANAADAPVDGLRFIIRSWITNEETQNQIIEALRRVGHSTFPGFANRQTFSRSSQNQNEVDGFYALLGTPNGAGSAFLLATHKGKLGVKRITSAQVWNHGLSNVPLTGWRDPWKLNMMFAIENVANPAD